MAGTMFGIGVSPAYPIATTPGWAPSYAGQGLGQPPWQQILQLVQIVPQQLQQIQTLQQQQLVYVQQLLQLVPVQLQQLQQLIQSLPLQASSLQPFGPSLAGPVGVGLLPQAYAGPSSLVM